MKITKSMFHICIQMLLLIALFATTVQEDSCQFLVFFLFYNARFYLDLYLD